MERLLSEACLACARRCDTSVITSGQAALRRIHTQRYAGEPAGPSAGPEKAPYYSQYKQQRHRWRIFSRLVETITAPAQ